MDKYCIISGYYSPDMDKQRQDFFNIWYNNTIKYANPKEIIIINADSKKPKGAKGEWIDTHNFLHCQASDNDPIKFCGWSVGFLMGITIAYARNCDVIYKEQDVLAFGNWVNDMYLHMKSLNLKMLIGDSPHFCYKVEQGLIIIKHEFIPKFISDWLSIPEFDTGVPDLRKRPEVKFNEVKQKNENDIGFIPFGFGAHTPESQLDFDVETFWIHRQFSKMTHKYINDLKQKRLI